MTNAISIFLTQQFKKNEKVTQWLKSFLQPKGLGFNL